MSRPSKSEFLAACRNATAQIEERMSPTEREVLDRLCEDVKLSGLGLNDLLEVLRAEGTEEARKAELAIRQLLAMYEDAKDD